MDNAAIRDFWEENPCGQVSVNPDEKDIKNFKEFFIRYDRFRCLTEGHILSNLDKIDFKGKKVLEIGIGQAADAQQIIDRGGEYYGIDITQEACNRAILRFKIFNKSYEAVKCVEAANIPFTDNYFDIIYSHGVLHHIPEIDKVIIESNRVLKKKGKLIIMLYAKESLNYYISILFLRRVLLTGMILLDKISGKRLIKNRLYKKHIENAEKTGILKYLSGKNFISKNTDGPDNPYSRVYSAKDVVDIFDKFYFHTFEHYFLNEKHLPFLKILPDSLKKILSKKLGWHLWCYGGKK
jgi:ubiquinone/menaquinone biosynthesis C-methylase UbiE